MSKRKSYGVEEEPSQVEDEEDVLVLIKPLKKAEEKEAVESVLEFRLNKTSFEVGRVEEAVLEVYSSEEVSELIIDFVGAETQPVKLERLSGKISTPVKLTFTKEGEQDLVIKASYVYRGKKLLKEEKLTVKVKRTVVEERLFRAEKNTYRLVQLVGEGEYAEVWKALDESGKAVAIKIYKRGSGTFIKEIGKLTELVKRLRKKPYTANYVVRIIEYGVGSAPYIVMDYYAENLRSLISRGVSHKDVIKIMARTARALAYASETHIYHGDLKPENILIKRENEKYYPVIADWGGGFTPCYAAPEIYEHGEEALTEKSDVWSFGVILCEVITRSKLFKNLTEYEKQIKNDVRVEILQNPRLEELVNRCLRKDPDERPSFKDVYKELYDYLTIELRTRISHGMRDLKTTLEFVESYMILGDITNAEEELKKLAEYDFEKPALRVFRKCYEIKKLIMEKNLSLDKIGSLFRDLLDVASADAELKERLDREQCLRSYSLLTHYKTSPITLYEDINGCVDMVVEIISDLYDAKI